MIFSSMNELISMIWDIFSVDVPGLGGVTFQNVYSGYFFLVVVIACIHYLFFGSASLGGGASYRVGRPKKSKKGESSE